MSQLTVLTAERISSDYNTPNASYQNTTNIASGGFVAGKKYLILARSEIRSETTDGPVACRLIHGSTAFAGSEMTFAPPASQLDRRVYTYMTVWTAVAGEAITLQVHGNGTVDVYERWTKLIAIRLSDSGLVENTDWFFSENTTPHTLTETPTAGASVTFTPATGGQAWLVLTDAMLEVGDSVLDQRGSDLYDGTTGWETKVGLETAANASIRPFPGLWVGTLSAASHTFSERSKRIGTNGNTDQRLRSVVFALNLARFDVATYYLNDAAESVPAGTWSEQLGTVTHPQVVNNGLALVLGYCVFNPSYDSNGARYATARVQVDQLDVFDVSGTPPGTYSSETNFARFVNPNNVSGMSNYTPYLCATTHALAAGDHYVDLDVGVINISANGAKFRRVVVISLDVEAAPPPAGAGGAQGSLERSEQVMYLNDYVAARRRVLVRCVDATDNVTPETGEAGGQPQISKNGGAFTSTGVGVLVAVEASNGLYYSELAATAPDLGSLRLRYKSAATALFTVALNVEPCPWLNDGVAQAGGANYLDLQNPPSAVPAGSILRILANTGAGQSAVVTGFSTPRCTIEGTWTTNPSTDSVYILEPGLPPTIPQVNPVQLDGDAAALQNLKAGAKAMLTGTLVTGTNNPTTLTTDLPITVGGVTTPTNFYKGRALYMRDGPQQGDVAMVTGSVVSGGNTVLTVDVLTGSPSVGNTFVLT
jgi:hypothetical protein